MILFSVNIIGFLLCGKKLFFFLIYFVEFVNKNLIILVFKNVFYIILIKMILLLWNFYFWGG